MATPYKPTALPPRALIHQHELSMGQGLSSRRDLENERDEAIKNEYTNSCGKVVEEHIGRFLNHSKLPMEERTFANFLREFHSEYDDQWFSQSYTRLDLAFRPIWNRFLGIKPEDQQDLLGVNESHTLLPDTDPIKEVITFPADTDDCLDQLFQSDVTPKIPVNSTPAVGSELDFLFIDTSSKNNESKASSLSPESLDLLI